MDCHDRHDCNGNCNTYLPPSARLLHRSVLYRTFSRASRHRATLHLVLVEEQITPDSPIPILCRLRQSADRLALYPFRLIAIPRQFQAMLWPLALILIGIFLLRHHHRRNWTHQRTVHRRAKMVQRMMNKRMGEQEEHSTRRNLHRPGLQLGEVELHIPADWQVRIECSCFCGGCEDKRWQGTPAKQAFLSASCSVFLPGQLSFCGIICRLWQTLHYKQKISPPPRQKRPLPCHKKKVLTGSR